MNAVADAESQISSGLISCCCTGFTDGPLTCVGNRRPEGGPPVGVDPRSLFEVASVSKVFTAAIAARLHADGRLDVDAPFTEYLPDHVLSGENVSITVRHLAAHCSGFSDGWRWARGGAWTFSSPEEFEAATLAARPVRAPGSATVYACHNMILLGFIIERVTGMDLDAAAREYVWGPLGMTRTSWLDKPDDPDAVQMYTHGPVPLGRKGDEAARAFPRPLGNAGVFTCAEDLMKFAADLLERRAFPESCYDLFFTPFGNTGDGRRSFGWNMSASTRPSGWSERTIAHTGYTGQLVAVDPLNRIAGIVLTNVVSDDPVIRAEAYKRRIGLLSRAR